MANRTPLAPETWYHCFNRGVDKRRVFQDIRDYERFLELMYVCNGTKKIHLSNLRKKRLSQILTMDLDRGEPLVEIAAYCLMPNHIHLILKQVADKGISLFMQKLFTGYLMYFNKRHDRTGALFGGAFKSKHLYDDQYLKHAIAYVHLNPAELFDTRWKQGKANLKLINKNIRDYHFSSFQDFVGKDRLENLLIGNSRDTLYDKIPTIKEILEEAHSYYQETPAAR